ncbi:contractile injection system protein, VgrG/Pvc8 family, partial [Escherichia coli]|nr:contractile injection system protein, VgrG/Pvc8 family [Escherichia coli]
MSLKGLRFTLEVDGQEPDTFAVVNFRLIQNQSYPFVMSVDVASDSFMQTAEMLLEKNATLTIWQGVIPLRYVTGVVAGFGMQENNGWQMRYQLRIEPPLWRSGGGRGGRLSKGAEKAADVGTGRDGGGGGGGAGESFGGARGAGGCGGGGVG